jgi:hypothetical protein
MNSYGALHLSTATQDITQSNMRIKGLGVNFQSLSKRIDSIILPAI